VIIYAPHITEISVTHGQLIEESVHVRDYFVKQMDGSVTSRGGPCALDARQGVGTFENESKSRASR